MTLKSIPKVITCNKNGRGGRCVRACDFESDFEVHCDSDFESDFEVTLKVTLKSISKVTLKVILKLIPQVTLK